jgi:hypothetical protein
MDRTAVQNVARLVGIVEEPEVHRLQKFNGTIAENRLGIGDHEERGREPRTVGRNRDRDYRPRPRHDFAGQRAGCGQEVDLSIGAADRDFAIGTCGHGIERGRHRNHSRRLRARHRPDADAEVVADADHRAAIGGERHAVDVLRMRIEHARRAARQRPQAHGAIP